MLLEIPVEYAAVIVAKWLTRDKDNERPRLEALQDINKEPATLGALADHVWRVNVAADQLEMRLHGKVARRVALEPTAGISLPQGGQ